MSLRIAMVGACPYPVPQGSQVFLRETALALQQQGHELHLVVYGHGLGSDDSGLTIHRGPHLPFGRRTAAGPSVHKPLLDLALVRTLRRVLREHPADAVCAHNYEALLVALAARARPIVYFAHNALSDELPYYFQQKELAAQVGRWIDRTFPRRADLVVAPHQRLAGHLAVRGCNPDKLVVIPPPMDAQLFLASEIGADMPPVLYAGNLDAYQNLGLLFDAMRLVRRQAPETRLQVATAQPAADLEEAEIIPVHDFAALVQVLAQDSVFAVPRVSWSGYPIKLLNAMAAGKAIVACESAAYPITAGVNGLVVPDNDPPAFADALLQLLMTPNLRKNLGQRARQTILEHHAPATFAQAFEEAFLQLQPAPLASEEEQEP
jgi:glycosyltransferase involved in cell wall biosynthesis